MSPIYLGISLNSRAVGIAVVQDGSLLDWRLHTKSHVADRTVTEIVRKYGIRHVALSYRPTHGSARAKACLERVRVAENIVLVTYSATDLLREIARGTLKNKAALFKHLAATYPELHRSHMRYERSRYRYWDKLFEAVACAHLGSLG